MGNEPWPCPWWDISVKWDNISHMILSYNIVLNSIVGNTNKK
jgi:hypothetical protein